MQTYYYQKGAVTLNILISILLIVLIIIAIVLFFMLQEEKAEVGTISDDEFSTAIEKGGDLFARGQLADAVAYYSDLSNKATTAGQEGQAKLNLALARMPDNRTAGLEMLKEVSLNQGYYPMTRTKASNYILNEFTSTKDEEFAKNVIFTGPIWEDFLGSNDSLDRATINAFMYFHDVYATPEASSRLALEYSKRLFEGLNQSEKDDIAQNVLNLINSTYVSINNLYSDDRIQFGDTHYSEIVTAYNRLGLALDSLYFNNYIEDTEQVIEAFQDGIDLIIENGNQQSIEGTELFVRYHYADFLLRADVQEKNEKIRKILAPSEKMTSQHNVSSFFKSRISDVSMNNSTPDFYPARPDSITLLSDISPEFKNALIKIGISASQIENARAN